MCRGILDVMPLIYNALESEHTVVSFPVGLGKTITNPPIPQVQEQALKVVPDLCETIDYAEVQGVLFPRVAVSISLSLTPGYLLKLSTLIGLARFHKNEDFERQSGNPFDLLDYGENT